MCQARGLKALLSLLLWSSLVTVAWGQTKTWDKTLGGSGRETLKALQQTSDGGYILGGFSTSNTGGDKSQDSYGGSNDYWVVKLDAAGTKVWDKTLGGDGGDYLYALQQTRDGGYILAGFSESNKSGDKSQDSKGGLGDCWVVKLDAAGNKVWDKTLGGDQEEHFTALQQTADGGYVLGGFSSSGISGDKSEPNRGACPEVFCTVDFWVVKLDSLGNKEWDKTLGGEESEGIFSLQQTRDGGYIVGGTSASGAGGDKTGDSRGSFDYWIVKLDAAGNKTWDKTYGSDGTDDLTALQQTQDGGYILGGSSASNASGDKSGNNRGDCPSPNFCTNDYWVLKLDSTGAKVWDQTLGGNDSDPLYALQQTPDGGYLLGGSSLSQASGDKTQDSRGSFDYWVVKLDAGGGKVWDRSYGGKGFEDLAALRLTQDGGFIIGGGSDSDAGDDKTEPNRGSCDPAFGCSSDFWVLKARDEPLPPLLSSFLPKKDVPGTEVTLRGRGFASTWAVRFNGQDAAFRVLSDEVILATVPINATSGKITVANAAGVVVSPGSFLVRHPGITAFSPSQGPVGETIYLQGDRLSTAKEVFFGGVKAAAFQVFSDSTMSAVVPEGASGKGRIKVVLAGGGYGNSKTKFVVTAPDSAALAGSQAARKALDEAEADPGQARVAAYPNPFRGQVTFRFRLPETQPVTVEVLDLLGREVSLLYQGEGLARQSQEVVWRPGPRQAAGLYLIRLQSPGQVQQTRVMLTR
ncbi:MAG: IPT/TIG domain-containing protein [Adhaeribacter sp.]